MCAIAGRQDALINAVSEALPIFGFSLPHDLVCPVRAFLVSLALRDLVELVLDVLLRRRCSRKQERD